MSTDVANWRAINGSLAAASTTGASEGFHIRNVPEISSTPDTLAEPRRRGNRIPAVPSRHLVCLAALIR
ncbi:hypothetical protein GCM10027445_65870 [Amycolatopsis endophytica]